VVWPETVLLQRSEKRAEVTVAARARCVIYPGHNNVDSHSWCTRNKCGVKYTLANGLWQSLPHSVSHSGHLFDSSLILAGKVVKSGRRVDGKQISGMAANAVVG